MSASSLDILNAIRSVAGSDYQARIPEATRTNIASVGNTILSYTPTANMFFSELINRIGKVIIDRMDGMDDIYSVFGEGKIDFGDTIQKVFVDIPSAQAFDDTFNSPTAMLNTSKGVIHVEYTKIDRRLFYKTTVSVDALREAFVSVSALDGLVKALIESMEVALGYDKYVMLTETLYEHCKFVIENGTKLPQLLVPNTVAVYNNTSKKIEWDTVGAKQFLKMLRVASRKLKFPHELWYGTKNGEDLSISRVRTPLEKQVIGLEVSTQAEIDVEALAVLFHMDKAEIDSRIIELEDNALGTVTTGSGASAKTVYVGGFICNKEAVERYTSFRHKDSFMNPEGLYTNFWSHFWGSMAVSKFKDFLPIVFELKAEGN